MGWSAHHDVRRAIINAGRGELLKPPYRHVDWSNETFLGSQGMFGHQLVGKGVSKPILYAGEVHSFINSDDDSMVTLITVFRLTDDGEVNEDAVVDVQMFTDGTFAASRRLTRIYPLLDGRVVQFGFKTFEQTVKAANDYVDAHSET